MLRSILARFLIVLLFAALAVGCNATPTVEMPSPAETSAPIVPTETPLPPTPTTPPVELALRVNGEGVPLAEFQASLAQIQQAQPDLSAEEQRRKVIDQLVEDTLLALAARQGGFQVDEAALLAREGELAAQAGGEAALTDWQTRNGYTPESFRSALRRGMEAAWQRDQILAAVPETAEQVHVRQILVLTEDAADLVKRQLSQAGANFATLAFGYDLSTGGDLGWFPRGYLIQPAVEEAAFALQPGEVSDIIKSDYGYHIIQVIAREERALTQDARQALQRTALDNWLEQNRAQSQVEELLP
ncbi:MAG: peptidylprolyl isomerase [Anaerolineaceae bacterium]|nr:peptidylprolyl isomerase [Anaerolineaceae bacterium]